MPRAPRDRRAPWRTPGARRATGRHGGIPRSGSRPSPETPSPISSPTGDRDARALAGLRFDGELVRQATRAAQPEPEPGAGGEAVAHRLLDIRDAGALVVEGQAQPSPAEVLDALDDDVSAAAILHGVPRQLACGGDNLRLIDQVESQLHGALPHRLAYRDDVFRGLD